MPWMTYVARGVDGLILCETWSMSATQQQQQQGGGVQQYKRQALQLIQKISATQGGGRGGTQANAPLRCSLDSSGCVFHYLLTNGLLYLTCCETGYPPKLAFAFLDDVHQAFQSELERTVGTATGVDYRSVIETVEKPYAFVKFDRQIQKLGQQYADARSAKTQALTKLNHALNEVHSIMRANIDDVLTRGDNLEDVSRRATTLKDASAKFRKEARYLNLQSLAQQYMPFLVVGGVLLLFFIYVLFLKK